MEDLVKEIFNTFGRGDHVFVGGICDGLRTYGLHPAMVTVAHSNHGWHLMAFSGDSQDGSLNNLLFKESVTGRPLYITVEGRTAMFNVFPSIEAAMEERPNVRKVMMRMNIAVAAFRQGFTPLEEV